LPRDLLSNAGARAENFWRDWRIGDFWEARRLRRKENVKTRGRDLPISV
jgi:hypothetical protein